MAGLGGGAGLNDQEGQFRVLGGAVIELFDLLANLSQWHTALGAGAADRAKGIASTVLALLPTARNAQLCPMAAGPVAGSQHRVAGTILVAGLAGVGPTGGTGPVEAGGVTAEHEDFVGFEDRDGPFGRVSPGGGGLVCPVPVGPCQENIRWRWVHVHVAGWVWFRAAGPRPPELRRVERFVPAGAPASPARFLRASRAGEAPRLRSGALRGSSRDGLTLWLRAV